MTSEFRIDRPGVYRQRDGEDVCLWPALSTGPMRWVTIGADYISSIGDDGRYWALGTESPHDIVAYVGPLPVEILQRMREALALAEGDEPQSPTNEFRKLQEPKQ